LAVIYFSLSLFGSSRLVGEMGGSEDSTPGPEVVELKPIEATPASFEEYGQVIEASPDGAEFGPQDAQLDLSRGIPRYKTGRSGLIVQIRIL
jgi:hypothetical protein